MKQINNKNNGCAGCGKQGRGGGSGSCSSCGGCTNGGCTSCGGCPRREIVITEKERDFLLLLAQIPFLPLARIVKGNAAEGAAAEMPEPVYLDSSNDTGDTVRENGAALLALESKRLVTLDYDKPLVNGDYSFYEKSAYLRNALKAGGKNKQSRPALEYGSIALTARGQSALDSLDI